MRRFDIEKALILVAALLRTNEYLSMYTIAKHVQTCQAIDRLYTAISIFALLGRSLLVGGFGARAFLRYPDIDYNNKVPGLFKWLVTLELFVHEVRQRV